MQFFATYAYFAHAHDMNGILSFFLAIISCWIPILGTVLGVLGAHDGWGELDWFNPIIYLAIYFLYAIWNKAVMKQHHLFYITSAALV